MSAGIVARPQLVYPEHCLSLADMLALAERVYGAERQYPVIARMIANTKVETRRFALPIAQLDDARGLARRTELYMQHARPLAYAAARRALCASELAAEDVDLLITTSCTGFVMPGIDAYLVNDLDLRPTVRRLPLAQLGCVAGAAALIAAYDYCRAYPHARVLVVAVELCSLCFFAERKDLSSAVCASIFGDGAAACIISGAAHGGAGLRLDAVLDYTVRDTEHYIRFDALDGGYHLTLDRGVMNAVPKLAPRIRRFLADPSTGDELEPDFVIAHTGGPRILDGLARALRIDDALLRHSHDSLREYGNTASVSVFDVLARWHDDLSARQSGHDNQRGLVVAFGPGFSMALLRAHWQC